MAATNSAFEALAGGTSMAEEPPPASPRLERLFSRPRLSVAEVVQQAVARGASEEKLRLLELWTRYWNCWNRNALPRRGMWWDKAGIEALLSDAVIRIQPEGIFKGKGMVVREYDNFAKRFAHNGDHGSGDEGDGEEGARDGGGSKEMDRRLRAVIVDELKSVTTAVYEVIIPEGILAEDGDDDDERHGAGGADDSLRQEQRLPGEDEEIRVFSVAEVLKWDPEAGKIKEIHYFGGGVRLNDSSIQGKLHRARHHRKRVASLGGGGGGRGEELQEGELEELGRQGSGVGFEEVMLNACTVSDDRPLVQLSLRYMEALLKWDREVVLSLVADSYSHVTAFSESFLRFAGQDSDQAHATSASKVEGEIDCVYADEDQNVVTIERKYVAGEKMTEIIDLLHWKEPGPQIWRHASYGFSWQGTEDGSVSGNGGGLLSKASSGRVSSVADLLADNRGTYDRTHSLNSKRSRDEEGEDSGAASQKKMKKGRSEPHVSFL